MITQQPKLISGQNRRSSSYRIRLLFIRMEGNMINIKLKELKEKANLNIKEISDRSGVPYSTVQKIFSGEITSPNAESLYKIVKVLGFTMEDLFEDPPSQKNDPADLLNIIDVQSKANNIYISSLKRDKRILSIAFAILVTFILCILIYDLLNGGIGFIHY